MSKDIRPRNENGQKHGGYIVYWPNGKLMYKTSYNNDKKIGYEEWYYDNTNILSEKTYYL
jgi:antitoxin component YwqK of YwqJK toxin-antitoxin module